MPLLKYNNQTCILCTTVIVAEGEIMKIAIISEFQKQTVNYGNNLQAYALNHYLHMKYPSIEVDTLWFQDPSKKHITSYLGLLCSKTISCIKNIISSGHLRNKSGCINLQLVKSRLKAFENFQKNITLCENGMTWKRLINSNYDIYIVGSDVVWAQSHYYVNKIKFIKFTTNKKSKKIAYAASFGRNWIPKENVNYIKKCLKDFDMITLREASAVQMLKSYGINNAYHVLDPTILISKDEWAKLENKPSDIVDAPYVFVYLLGADKAQRESITAWSRQNNLQIITIPYANGLKKEYDLSFGDIKLSDCSPEEWIWLIHHADYVITDSFHGIVFSTIFENRFFAVTRDYTIDINIRLIDFLETIKQKDKMISNCEFKSADEYKWDYEKINQRISNKITESEKCLQRVLALSTKM